MLQCGEQLVQANMEGVAFLAGQRHTAIPNPEVISKYLPDDYLTVETLALQWLYQFLILEGISTTPPAEKPLAEWPPMFLDLYVKGLHFMVYMAALLCLMEEGKIKFDLAIPKAYFLETEESVQARVEQTTKNLYRKAQDYGESFRRHGVVGLIPRLWDKIARYATLSAEDRVANFESRQDSARDLLGYSVIAYSLLLEVPAVANIQKTEVSL